MQVALVLQFSRREYFDLSDVRVTATVLVLDYADLNLIGLYEFPASVSEWKHIPSARLFKFNLFNFLHFVERVVGSDADLGGSVAFVGFEIEVDRKFLYFHFFQKLNVHYVRLLTIGLPKSCHLVVSKLFNPVTVFGR